MTIAALSVATLAILSLHAKAQETKPFVHPIFSDNMVLQRGISAPVWGWAKPGEIVTVRFAGKSAVGKADSEGKWTVKIGSFKEGGPYELAVLSASQKTILKNVLVGDVWICSGQSNMEMGIGNVDNAQAEIASATNNHIRLFSVPKTVSYSPLATVNGKWESCTPQTVAAGGWNGFSAVGYFFGRELEKNLHIPIGLIHTSWGGTIAEAWTSGPALLKMDDFKKQVEQIEAMNAEPKITGMSLVQKMVAWYEKNDPGTSSHWEKNEADSSSWKTMKLPVLWEDAGLPNYDGVVWFRKEITLGAEAAGKPAMLNLGPIDDRDVTWVNGVKVGSADVYNVDRSYKIPAGVLKEGKNVISIRVLDTGGGGGVYGKPEQMTLVPNGGAALILAGDWHYNASADLIKTTSLPISTDNNPNVVTVLYNGMIAPILPFGVKGAIWYQGESNAGRAFQYRALLPTMIRDWRARFEVGEFPFYIVQLANYQGRQTKPVDDQWAELREAQSMTAKMVGNSAVAVTTDIGDAADIHPKNKQEVGRRLALNALALTYRQKVEYSGPAFVSMSATDGAVHLKFSHIGTGMMTKGGKLEGFAIAGADKKFVWAEAKIVGNEVVLSSPDVKIPVAVRYAWHINPIGNLYNSDGLPASPFRTDDFPGITVNNH